MSGVSSSLSWLESVPGSLEAEQALGQVLQLAFQVRLPLRTLVGLLAALQWWLQPAERGAQGLPHFRPDFLLEGPNPQLARGMEEPSLQLTSFSGCFCWSNFVSAP